MLFRVSVLVFIAGYQTRGGLIDGGKIKGSQGRQREAALGNKGHPKNLGKTRNSFIRVLTYI